MRALRAVAATMLASAVFLVGCGPSGSPSGSPSGPPSGDGPASASASPTPTTPGASPSASPTASPTPVPATRTLVRVTRSGGFAGRTTTLIVKEDGSWTRLDAKAQPTGTGKLARERLDALSEALRKAEFARLPRISTGGPVIYDGFFYAFVHGGHEVAADDGSLPPPLRSVLEAMPPFEE